MFPIVPSDYKSHNRGPRKIDFVLRQLTALKQLLESKHNIPLITLTMNHRKTVPQEIIKFCKKNLVSHIFGNIEYEIDELGRDKQTVEEAIKNEISFTIVHDACVVPPGKLFTKSTGKVFSVYSPFKKSWYDAVNVKDNNWIRLTPSIPENYQNPSNKDHPINGLLGQKIPKELEGYVCKDRERMIKIWPVGVDVGEKILTRFMITKTLGKVIDADTPPFDQGEVINDEEDLKNSRIARYGTERSRLDLDSSSRLSPYLSAGILR